MPLFVAIEPVNLSTDSSGSGSTGLETWSGTKKKARVESVYSRGLSYKKPRKPEITGGVVDLSAGPLSAALLHLDNEKHKVSWGSEVENNKSSMSGVLDIENMANTIAKETSYTESDEDDKMNKAMLRKTQTHTYMLGKSPKAPTFDSMSDDENALSLPSPKMFNGSNQILAVKSHVMKKRSFKPVKSFTLDVELSAVSRNTNNNKLISIKNFFYKIDGFGGASTPSKFSGVIRSTFTSESSLIKAKKMAVYEKIVVNSDLKKANIHSNWKVVIKEIPVDLLKLAVESVFSKFGKIVSIRMQLIGFWRKAQIEFKSSEVVSLVTSKWDQHQAMLYTLPMGTSAHNLSDLLMSYGGKTCFIGHNPSSYVRNQCAIICFENEAARLAAVCTILIFKSVGLYWTSLVLASCAKCKQFGHITVNCSVGESSGIHGKRVVSDHDQICLASIYKKKLASIVCLVSFGGKTWAQVASGTLFHVFAFGSSGSCLRSGLVSPSAVSDPLVVSHLGKHLAVLEHSLELLADCVSGILVRLDSFGMVSSVSFSLAFSSVASAALGSEVNSDMIVDNASGFPDITSPVTDDGVVNLSASSSKVLTAKVGGLETKLVALEASVGLIATCNVRGINNYAKQADIVCWHKDMNNLVSIVTETKLREKICPWIADRFDGVHVFTSGLDSGHMGSGVAIILNSSLARHVCKVSEVPGWLLSMRLLFKNKLFVLILGLYAGASLVVLVNESFFVILGSDFNENSSHKYASFKKCFNLGLVNSLGGSSFVKSLTWCNSCGVTKTIDYVFVSSNLINVVMDHSVTGVNDFFDTDYRAVSVSVGIGELLDLEFKDTSAANASMFLDAFGAANIVHKIIILSADGTFKRKWFKGFDSIFTKVSSRFHKLELLVSKLVKASHSVSSEEFVTLLEVWHRLDSPGALVVRFLFLLGSGFNFIHSALAKARKLYCASKLLESKRAEESSIKQAISKRMKSFKLDKGHTIRSVLECPFHKVILDHLVMEDELILEPDFVKSKMDEIMEEWTRKRRVVSDISRDWAHQYQPLKYVFNGAFSGVMCPISFDEMSAVVKDLLDGKTAGLSGISNKLWKCCDKSVLNMLLMLLNLCLKKAWVSMIPKLYEWKGVLMNTYPIVLIETACKILSKILSDRISLACSAFDVFCRNNFSVLKGTTTQSPIFAVGLVIENALEKNRELCLVRIKMCEKFIRFFGSIYNGYVNRVMTDFGLTDGYCVHDRLEQGESKDRIVCNYRLNSHFISKTGQVDPQAGLSSFFAAGAFVDNTIWVGSSQAVTQHIFDVAMLDLYLTISGADVWFFVNLVLKKAVSDKQCAYLVSAVFFPIISYRTQFNALVCKILKFKSGLSCDFPNDALHHLSLYGLKTFEQIQAESKLASAVTFANSAGILGHFFSHRSHDFQVFSWHPRYPLLFSSRIGVNPSNNFLAGVVCIFSRCDLSLDGSLACAFCHQCGTSMSLVLGEPCFFRCVSSLRCYGIAFVEQLHDHNGDVFSWRAFKHWKRLDFHGPILFWFDLSVHFLGGVGLLSSSFSLVNGHVVLDICLFHDFGVVCNTLLTADAAHLFVYTDGSLSGLGTVDVKAGAAIFFEDINLGLGVGMSSLVSFTLTELQAIALALECVPSSYSIDLFLDSQAALDACRSEFSLVCLDFRNCCWIEHCHIAIVKGHSGVSGNEHADTLAKDTALSAWCLPHLVSECFLCTGDMAVSSNSKHFSSMIWHTNSYLASGFTSMCTASCRTYFIKALYHWLSVVVRKHLYDRRYPSVVCLFCGDVEISDHALSGLTCSSSCVSQVLASCISEVGIGVALCKGFVFDDWFRKSVSVFKNSKEGTKKIVGFVRKFYLAFRDDIWLVCTKHWAFMERHGLIPHDEFVFVSISGLSVAFLAGVIRLLGVAKAFEISFGFCKLCLFFSGIGDPVSVHISV
ncbi:hypothetical protein G9A89_020072 [Geosiphon pyriformis]|nr:hypothetical protein G9A89_020072 [Geosiphon pyriformis]